MILPKFFVLLEYLLKMFRTPTQCSLAFRLELRMTGPLFLMPPKYTLNDLIFISHNHAHEKIVPDKEWLDKSGKNSD